MNRGRISNDRPDIIPVITYLNRVKSHFGADEATFHHFAAEVSLWVDQQRRLRSHPISSDFSQYKPIIYLASILRFDPKLLHGLNALLQPSERLECSLSVTKEVKYFVITKRNCSKIFSTSSFTVPYPSSTDDLREVIFSEHSWSQLLERNPEKEWLVCVSQVLQVILDDPLTDARYLRRAYRCLRELASQSILPPSTFINGLNGGTGHAVQGGAFADIYKGNVDGKPVCFRVLRMFETTIEDRDLLYKDFCSEVLVWRQLRHPNILPFIGANLELFEPRFCFISPWMNNGDIMSYLKQHPDHDRFKAICEIVEGIEYLHGLNPPVTHKDIKGANVLVGDDLVCCLADFGLSSIVESQRLGKGSPAFEGSVCWAAPEIMDPSRCFSKNAKAGDIYALACTIYEIYTGKPPFLETNRHKPAAAIMLSVLRGERPSLPPVGNWTNDESQLWWLVDLCWKDKPEDRPNMRLIKQVLRDIGPFETSRKDAVVSLHHVNAGVNLDVVEKWLRRERTYERNLTSSSRGQVRHAQNILERRHKGPSMSHGRRELSTLPALASLQMRPENEASFKFSGSTGLLTPSTPSFKSLDDIIDDFNFPAFIEPETEVNQLCSNLQSLVVGTTNEKQGSVSESPPTLGKLNQRIKHLTISGSGSIAKSLPSPPSTPSPVFPSSTYLSDSLIPPDSSARVNNGASSNLGFPEGHKRSGSARRRTLDGPRAQTSSSSSSASSYGKMKPLLPQGFNYSPSPLRRYTSPLSSGSGSNSASNSSHNSTWQPGFFRAVLEEDVGRYS